MPVSNPVIRRYTPPTCTLEVLAQNSPLSRWTGKTVLKELRFELRFDDPRLSEEHRVTIRGDRDQLEALSSVVSNYVQEFLQMSPDSFWGKFSEPKDETISSEHPEAKNFNNPSIATKTLNSFNSQIPPAEIHIAPSSHLTHNLFLGSLGYQASTSVIQLSLLQLFDLASALDEYSTDVMALPTLNNSSSAPSVMTWAPVAAVLLLAAVSIPFTLQYANNTRQKQQTTANSTQSQQKIAQETSPAPSAFSTTPVPALTPPDILLQAPLSTNVPAPNSALPPTPAGTPIPPTPGANPALPTTPQTAAKPTLPTTPVPSSGSVLTIPQPKTPSVATQPGKTDPLTSIPPIAIQPNPTNAKKNGTASTIPNNPTSLSPAGDLPSSIPPASNAPEVPPPLADQPLGNASSQTSSSSVARTTSAGDNSSLADKLRQRGNATQEKVATSNRNSTLFDTPQVAEAREYLKKRWQPPAQLSETLQYSLTVSVDGSIERIFPLGRSARIYIDRTGMPLIGDPFVSPNKNGQSVKIRAVLSPDGKVQTFPETED